MRPHLRSERVKLPRVHRVTRNGKVYKYHRVTRAELPSDVPEDHPTFIAAWTAQEVRKAPARAKHEAGTIGHGIAVFLVSSAYRDMSAGYRALIRRHIDAIGSRASAARMADLRARHITADMDNLTPAVAGHRLKAWRKLCQFWVARGMIEEDVARAVRRPRMPQSDGHREWTQNDVEAFRRHWQIGTPQRLAFELLQWTGARASDAVRLGPGMIDRDGLLSYQQVKTGGPALVPWFAPALGLEHQRADLLAMTADRRHMVWLTTAHGKPRSHKAFSSWFSDAATQAGLADLSGHGLRKYRMNVLAESGASLLQMQAWVGHATLAEVEHYTRRAQRRVAFLGPEQTRNPVKNV